MYTNLFLVLGRKSLCWNNNPSLILKWKYHICISIQKIWQYSLAASYYNITYSRNIQGRMLLYCISVFAYEAAKKQKMVKKSSYRGNTAAPLASFESLMSIESAADDINWKTGSEEKDNSLETPWASPAWQRMSLRNQNCQVYRVCKAMSTLL